MVLHIFRDEASKGKYSIIHGVLSSRNFSIKNLINSLTTIPVPKMAFETWENIHESQEKAKIFFPRSFPCLRWVSLEIRMTR